MEKFYWILTTSFFLVDLTVRLGLSLRVIMRKREASATLAWLVVILLLPFIGAGLYLLLGEYRLGQKRAAHAAASVPMYKKWVASLNQRITLDKSCSGSSCLPVETQAARVIGLPTLPGNALELIDRPDDFFRLLIADIEEARHTCFLEFYIWEEGGQADQVAAAVLRAARRGVSCRILLDSIGSRAFLHGEQAASLRQQGVEIVESLPAGLFRAHLVRLDLRNHRKMAIIDGQVAYTGSHNLVDPQIFKQEEDFGEWIDATVRVRGPVVEAMSATFYYDWQVEGELSQQEQHDIGDIPAAAIAGQVRVQLVPSGPGFTQGGIHDLLLTTIYNARRELVLTSPYFVPDNAILAALKSAALMGVEVTLIVPSRSDSRLVQYASRARYSELARSGVRIMTFDAGLLHAKIITVDREFSLIGSVNLDMRSFWLNFELTLFVYDQQFTEQLGAVQQRYIEKACQLDPSVFARRSFAARFLENCALLLGPLL